MRGDTEMHGGRADGGGDGCRLPGGPAATARGLRVRGAVVHVRGVSLDPSCAFVPRYRGESSSSGGTGGSGSSGGSTGGTGWTSTATTGGRTWTSTTTTGGGTTTTTTSSTTTTTTTGGSWGRRLWEELQPNRRARLTLSPGGATDVHHMPQCVPLEVYETYGRGGRTHYDVLMDGVQVHNATLNVVESDPLPSYHFHSGDCNTDATTRTTLGYIMAGFVFCVCWCAWNRKLLCWCTGSSSANASPDRPAPAVYSGGVDARQERARVELQRQIAARNAAAAAAPPPAREVPRPARVVPVARMTTDQMFDRLRELRPTAGTEELRTILNRAAATSTPPSPRSARPPRRTADQPGDGAHGRAGARRSSPRRRERAPPASGCRRTRRSRARAVELAPGESARGARAPHGRDGRARRRSRGHPRRARRDRHRRAAAVRGGRRPRARGRGPPR